MNINVKQLKNDYQALQHHFLGRQANRQTFEEFRMMFYRLLSRYHLDDLKYAVQAPDRLLDRESIVITPLTAASEIILYVMMGLDGVF